MHFRKGKSNTFGQDFESSSGEDAIIDSSMHAFFQRGEVEKCMPFMTVYERVWKRLQKRGILNMKAEFPEKQLASSNVIEIEFRHVLVQAYHFFNIEHNLLNRDWR